jgi:hypothetical protein
MNDVIILGSGRSGTSMLAATFQDSGYYLGDNYLGQNNSNPKGFFEDYEVNTINEDILKKYFKDYPEWYRRIFCPKHTFYRARWLAVLDQNNEVSSDAEFKKRIQERISQSPFCYKDPRFSYTLPVWTPFLSMNTLFICIYREPQNTAESIVKECQDSQPLRSLKMDFKQALRVWKSMHLHVLKHYENTKDDFEWIFVHYNQLLDLSAFKRLNVGIGINLKTSVPDKAINRTKSKVKVNQKVNEIYQKLNKLSGYEQ